MRRAIREHIGDFAALLGLFVVASLIAGYILENQRLRFPIIEPEPFQIKAAFSTAQAVTPGQGQTVRVAGVRVGDIAKTQLVEGRAIITMDLDQEFKDLVRKDATAFLRPKTGLKDMFVELNPGTKRAPLAKEGWMLPIASTLPDVNPDEFLSSLDVDTRDYLKLLLDGAGRGLEGRSDDLRAVLRRFEPTHRDLALVNTEIATRRRELARLIESLAELNGELATRDDDLAELVGSSAQVFRAFASERRGVSATIRELPSALRTARDSLERVERMAEVLRPTADNLRPAVRALDEANQATRPLAIEATPQLRDDIRPFIREARPLVRDLGPATRDLADAEPDLKRTFKVINHLFNMLAFNKDGREGPDEADRDEGYLFYFGWLGHQTNNLFQNSDAHGPGRPITTAQTCQVLTQSVGAAPQLEALLGLTGALTDPNVCGGSGGGGGPDQEGLPALPAVPGVPGGPSGAREKKAEGR
jgi:phospholipid/cholesterol/gamma-HCH transport system substrate-binding protein